MAYSVNKGIIKIPDVDDEVMFNVKKCEVVESLIKEKDGTPKQEVKFTAQNGDALFIGRETADRQLLRLGFGEGEGDEATVFYGDVDGTTLRFYRVKNKNPMYKPYFNIDRIVNDEAPPRPSLVQAAKQEAERVRKAKGLPKDDGGSMGPYIPGLDDDPDDPGPSDPYADDDGLPPVSAPQKIPTLTAEQANKEGAINAAYARAYAYALGVQGAAATPESVQRGTATLLIQYAKAGVC